MYRFYESFRGRQFGKLGAESVYLVGDKKSGVGIAIKIEDGNTRALYPVVLEVLKQLGLLKKEQIDQLASYHVPKLRNTRNEEIGKIVVSFKLKG
ncbi:MAG: asparaginase [Candidatus Caldatribacteriota bacterium]|nr:asparaginase [Candidatus Caldatribacteriota bacterium]